MSIYPILNFISFRLVDLHGEKQKFLASQLGITVGRARYLLDIVRGRTLASEKSLGDNGEPIKKSKVSLWSNRYTLMYK
jgi:hypothetical protein